jgi:transposase
VFEAIRRDRRDDPDVSIRELAARHGVHRRTVRQALASAEPPPRKVPVRTAPVLDPVKPLIDAMLRQDLDAPRKQRHTALRIRERLLDEHQLVVAYSTVRDYVREARPRIAAEAGRQLAEVFVPQTHPAGAEAEVDFADLWIVLAGVKTKVFLFTLRLSYSGKAVHRAYATCSQEAFLDGHRYAFEQLGGIPFVHIRYDNLKAAVSRVLTGRTRVESDRWVLFRSHYGFDVFYCRPGVEGAHEKGGVEGEGGRFRRNHTVPMPTVESLAELNAYLAKCDAKDDHRRVGQRRVCCTDR